MRKVFRKFVRHFHLHTVSAGKLSEEDVMYKYLSTLENLAPRFCSETFRTLSLELLTEDEKLPFYINGGDVEHADCGSHQPNATHHVMVSGMEGIRWRLGRGEDPPESGAPRNYFSRKTRGKGQKAGRPVTKAEPSEPKWIPFCDFQDITHIVVSQSRVSVNCQDNKCL
ncbi:PREDICTED: non-receptor tyrosine-protein kinase TYK2-like, partial [Nanorana parkeri]|uniref:non-receptor tyrosine-protein kinase TYK2-like n=1 Tax=Nanorana parkeri TaxID=125878 RepID=UPI000854CCB6